MFGFLSNVMNFADANKFFNNGFQNIMKFNPFDFQAYFNNNSNNNDAKETPPAENNASKENEITELANQIDELKSEINKLNKEKVN